MPRTRHRPRALLVAVASVVAVVAVVAAATASPAAAEDPKLAFENLVEQHPDDDGPIIELWKRHPGKTLHVIDSYLEGSLALMEASDAPDTGRVKAMHALALRGAACADAAFGTPIFGDYASSFVGWTPEQRRQFRAGQQAFAEARRALAAGDHSAAWEAGTSCLEKARPLGDWWGTAMGHTAIAAAAEGLDRLETALAHYSVARLLYHDLELGRSEHRCVSSMASLLVRLERHERAGVTIARGLDLVETLGDADGRIRLLELRATVEGATGHTATAAETRRRIETLRAEQAERKAKERREKESESDPDGGTGD